MYTYIKLQVADTSGSVAMPSTASLLHHFSIVVDVAHLWCSSAAVHTALQKRGEVDVAVALDELCAEGSATMYAERPTPKACIHPWRPIYCAICS